MSTTQQNYGESEYGERLNFDNRKCRDPLCAIIYLLHVGAIIGAAVYITTDYYDEVKDQVADASANVPDIGLDNMDWTGIWVCLPPIRPLSVSA